MPGYITQHLTQGKKIARDLDLQELRDLLGGVVGQVRHQNLMLGVSIDLPAEHHPDTALEHASRRASC
jgi:hypothetical protein